MIRKCLVPSSFFFILLSLSFPKLALANTPDKVGASACIACHSDQGEAFKKNIHSRTFPAIKKIAFEESCETCHGPGSLHMEAGGDRSKPGFATIKNPKNLKGAESAAICLQCHDNGKRMFWKGSQHESRNLACVQCHSMHSSKGPSLLVKNSESETCYQCHLQRKAQGQKSTHMPIKEGKLQCTSCHNPHGSAGPKLLAQNSTNENCYSCHAEKRGPFLWDHPPVRENCLNCHDAHGSNHDKLLKVKRPRLCQQCHNEGGPGVHVSVPGTPAVTYALERACLKCHPMIHGSNHPQGVRFQR
ncbi:MAG: hypothetical protein A3A86_03205 [Elusimicrobia bacterium RIFCSPLOWO2_01_FULL_60_11]|nr:MAG: hypothetical protein A3A86_03205 [Elusimicrobia bacterium RIFCSPLOWO2_01_FULL_60_11]